MKRGFTLIELLIVVVVIAALTTIIFRLAGVGSESTARAVTVSRLQRIENALSGYYAAFGTYPPVPLQGSRDIYQKVDYYHGVQLDDVNKQTIVTSGTQAQNMREQILAACRSQPFGAYFPFKSGMADKNGVVFYRTKNSYTADEWQKMEKAGAVFLPAAGYRFDTGFSGVGYRGIYWSSSISGTTSADCLSFNSTHVGMDVDYRGYGFSVRLVRQ